MFVVTVTFEAYPERAVEFLARVQRQAADSLANEDGCHRFDVCIDLAQPERVFLYEVYAHAAAFEAHKATSDYLVGWIDCFGAGDARGRGLIHDARCIRVKKNPGLRGRGLGADASRVRLSSRRRRRVFPALPLRASPAPRRSA